VREPGLNLRPFVSVIMPCRNEEKHIGRCLDSILANDYPKECIEILVIDGQSTDRTREIVERHASRSGHIRLIDNRAIVQTYATNFGLKAAKGEYIIRMDAHAEYPSDYIRTCVDWLEREQVDVVGGVCETKPGGTSTVARAISMVLSSPFGVGNSYFRTGITGPRLVDTVPFGCYRREIFDRVGLFDERLDRTDDLEFNLRVRKNGGRLLLVPVISSIYYARPTLWSLAKQNFGNGFWIMYSLKFVRLPFSGRHLVPMLFVLSLLSGVVLSAFTPLLLVLSLLVLVAHAAANFIFSFSLSARQGLQYFPLVFLTFFVLHISYGIGSLAGALKLLLPVRSKGESIGR
jgi:glycosyltransferase involved in cell wall biosynthesis